MPLLRSRLSRWQSAVAECNGLFEEGDLRWVRRDIALNELDTVASPSQVFRRGLSCLSPDVRNRDCRPSLSQLCCTCKTNPSRGASDEYGLSLKVREIQCLAKVERHRRQRRGSSCGRHDNGQDNSFRRSSRTLPASGGCCEVDIDDWPLTDSIKVISTIKRSCLQATTANVVSSPAH